MTPRDLAKAQKKMFGSKAAEPNQDWFVVSVTGSTVVIKRTEASSVTFPCPKYAHVTGLVATDVVTVEVRNGQPHRVIGKVG